MSLLDVVIDILGPDAIFSATKSLAFWIFAAVSPVLLLVSVALRIWGESVSTISGQGKWVEAIRDILIFGVGLGCYFALAQLVFEFFNALYVVANQNGSLEAIGEMLKEAIAKAKSTASAVDTDGILNALKMACAWAAHFFTYLLLHFLSILLRLAHALTFGVVFTWGLIALPLSITTQFKLLGGWAKMLAITLIWPVVESILFYLVSAPFIVGKDKLIDAISVEVAAPESIQDWTKLMNGASVMDQLFIVYASFGILNLVLCAVVVAAPFITMALVNNSGSITGMVMPFTAAAGGAAKTYFEGLTKGGQGGKFLATQIGGKIGQKLGLGDTNPSNSTPASGQAGTGQKSWGMPFNSSSQGTPEYLSQYNAQHWEKSATPSSSSSTPSGASSSNSAKDASSSNSGSTSGNASSSDSVKSVSPQAAPSSATPSSSGSASGNASPSDSAKSVSPQAAPSSATPSSPGSTSGNASPSDSAKSVSPQATESGAKPQDGLNDKNKDAVDKATPQDVKSGVTPQSGTVTAVDSVSSSDSVKSVSPQAAPSSATPQNGSSPSGTSDISSSESKRTLTPEQKQERRGVIINNNRKR